MLQYIFNLSSKLWNKEIRLTGNCIVVRICSSSGEYIDLAGSSCRALPELLTGQFPLRRPQSIKYSWYRTVFDFSVPATNGVGDGMVDENVKCSNPPAGPQEVVI